MALSALDVAEILEEQSASGRRFGEVALAWGLCQPQDVWDAWASQLAHRTPAIDLRSFGVDAQAAAHLPARLARRFGAVAVRTTGDTLVVATAEAGVARASRRLGRLLGKKVRYVVAPPEQIAAAIARYYPAAAPITTPTGSAGPARTPSVDARLGCAPPSAAAAKKSPGSLN